MTVLPIFVSSTFRDFHAERDCLLHEVTPRLDDLLRHSGCRVEMIDLRWGVDTSEIDEEDAQQRRVLDVCLGELGRAKPLFLGLVGDRYGWVPPRPRMRSAVATAGLDTLDTEGWSVTALELEVGAIQAENTTPVVLVRHLRSAPPEGWADADGTAQQKLKERIGAAPRVQVHHYDADVEGRLSPASVAAFEDLAFEKLAPLVEARAREFGAEVGDPYLMAERLFMQERTGVLIGRSALLEEVKAAVGSGGRVCLLGASGHGKSAIWCAAVDELRAGGSEVASVAVGISPGTTSIRDVVGQVMRTLGDALVEPVDDDDAVERLRACLAGRDAALAVDGIDGLDPGEASDRLALLVGLPAGTGALCTTTSPTQATVLAAAGYEIRDVTMLSASEVASMVEGLSGRSRRTLPARAVAELSSNPRSPLWVELALSEFLALDEDDFELLPPGAEAIADLIVRTAKDFPDDVEGLARRVLDRCATRCGDDVTTAAVGLLAVSRSGLSPLDLVDVTGYPTVAIAGVRRRLAGMVAVRGEGDRLGFTHGLMRQAALQRFVGDDTRWHARLASSLSASEDRTGTATSDRVFHAVLSGGQPGPGPVLETVCGDDGSSADALLAAFTDALVAGAARPGGVADLLAPLDSFGPRATGFLVYWAGHPSRFRCPASVRREVTDVAVQRAKHFQPHGMWVPPRGTHMLAAVLPPRAADIAYFEFVRTAEGHSAEMLLARALCADAAAMMDVGEPRMKVRKALFEGRRRLHDLSMFHGDLTNSPSVHSVNELRQRVLLELSRAEQLEIELETTSSVRSNKKLAVKVEEHRSRTQGLVDRGNDSYEDEVASLRAMQAEVTTNAVAGQHDAAAALAERLLGEVESMASVVPGPVLEEERRRALLAAGEAAVLRRDIAEAVRLTTEHDQLATRRLEEDPTSRARLAAVVDGLRMLADAYGEAAAPNLIARFVDRARQLVALDPDYGPSRLALSQALEHLADHLTRIEQYKAAQTAYDEALGIRKRLQRKGESGDFAALKLLDGKKKVARVRQRGRGLLSKGADVMQYGLAQRALRPIEDEADRASDDATRMLESGDASSAVIQARKAVLLTERLAAGFRRWVPEADAAVAEPYRLLARCELALSDHGAAIDAYDAAVSSARSARSAAPSDPSVLSELFDSLHGLGGALDQDDDRRLAVWTEAVDVGRAWVAREPERAQPHRGLADALIKLSLLVWPATDASQALPVLEDTVESVRVVLARDQLPMSEPAFRRALRRLGDARCQTGDTQGGLTVYEELVACERVAWKGAEDPVGAGERLADALRAVAQCARRLGDENQAGRLEDEARSLQP